MLVAFAFRGFGFRPVSALGFFAVRLRLSRLGCTMPRQLRLDAALQSQELASSGLTCVGPRVTEAATLRVLYGLLNKVSGPGA